jgi:TRAP-type C4-dicarboxylate transport system permease small subunit
MRFWRAITTADRFVGGIFLFSLILLVILDTVLRAFSLTPFMGTMELVRCFLIWSVFIAVRYITAEGAHIRMGEIVAFFPKGAQRALSLITHATAVAVFGLITVSSISTTVSNARDTTPTLEIPFVLFFLPTIIGFLLATVQYAILLNRIWRHGSERNLEGIVAVKEN